MQFNLHYFVGVEGVSSVSVWRGGADTGMSAGFSLFTFLTEDEGCW